MRKNNRQPGLACLISWYWTMTGEAGGSVIGERIGEGRADACGCFTVACTGPEDEGEDRHDRGGEIFSDRSRGGGLVSRPRAFPQRRHGIARRRVRAQRPLSPGLTRFARRRRG